MPAVSNKTHKPLSVPLPGGKTLHLGPGRTGQVTAKAVEDPRLRKLVEAGDLEIVDEERQHSAGPGGSTRPRSAEHRQTPTGHRTGNR